jgi:hypothetical protein
MSDPDSPPFPQCIEEVAEVPRSDEEVFQPEDREERVYALPSSPMGYLTSALGNDSHIEPILPI